MKMMGSLNCLFYQPRRREFELDSITVCFLLGDKYGKKTDAERAWRRCGAAGVLGRADATVVWSSRGGVMREKGKVWTEDEFSQCVAGNGSGNMPVVVVYNVSLYGDHPGARTFVYCWTHNNWESPRLSFSDPCSEVTETSKLFASLSRPLRLFRCPLRHALCYCL